MMLEINIYFMDLKLTSTSLEKCALYLNVMVKTEGEMALEECMKKDHFPDKTS